MMDLVLEQVHQQAVAALVLYPCVAIDPDDIGEARRCLCLAERDQAPVHRGLRRLQLRKRWKRQLVLPGTRSEPSAFQRIDIEQVDDVEVVERALQAGEEAGARGREFSLSQVFSGREQAVVGPGVVVGECAKGLNEVGRHRIALDAEGGNDATDVIIAALCRERSSEWTRGMSTQFGLSFFF